MSSVGKLIQRTMLDVVDPLLEISSKVEHEKVSDMWYSSRCLRALTCDCSQSKNE